MRVRPLVSIAAALLLWTTTASAANFLVDSTLDDVDVLPGDGDCLTVDNKCTLRAAFQETSAWPGPDKIVVPPGTYVLTIPGAQEDAGATGDLDATGGTLELLGSDAATTIIDANGLDRAIEFRAPKITDLLTLRGFTIQNGATLSGVGGGVFTAYGRATIVDCVVQDNLGNIGGGLYLTHASTIARTIVRRNTAVAGGGVRGYQDLTIVDSTISDNRTIQGAGGGFLQIGGELHIERSTIVGNEAITDGGGIAMAGEELVVTNSTISGNVARRDGGGIWQDAFYEEGAGGFDDVAPVDLRNVTLVGNRSDADNDGTGDGGGVYARSTTGVLLRNSILAGNIDSGGEAPDCGGMSVIASGRNLVRSLAGCTLSGDSGGVLSGVDPELAPLADNGGAAPTHAPLANSPVIDAGSALVPGTGGASCEPNDQRGRVRPLGQRCDLGAYEDGDLCAAPVTGCTPADPGGARLTIKSSTKSGGQLTWSWRGAIASPAEVGTPLAGTNYTVCIYETVAGVPHAVSSGVLPGGVCDGKPCWKASSAGFAFKNHTGAPSGFVQAKLRASVTRPGDLSVKARGPAFVTPALPLVVGPEVLVQVKRADASQCWEARFSSVRRNDPIGFNAQSE